MKKGAMSWEFIATAVIVLVVVVIALLIFRSGSDKAEDSILDSLDNSQDGDGDGVPSILDKCPCDATIGQTFPDGVTECKTKCE